MLSTLPEALSTTADSNAYFIFRNISIANQLVILTVRAPSGDTDAQFLVDLEKGTIEPYNP